MNQLIFFQGGPVCDDDRLIKIYKSILAVLEYRHDGAAPPILFDYYQSAIVSGSTIVNSGFLTPGKAENLSIVAINSAIDVLVEYMKVFDHIEAKKVGDRNRPAAIEFFRSLETVIVAVKSLVGGVNQNPCLQALVSCFAALRTYFKNPHLASFLEERAKQVALIEDVLAAVRSGKDWFDIGTFPKLRNGDLKICSLNASLGVVLKVVPQIRQKLNFSKPLSREVGMVLDAGEPTSLIGVKKALLEYEPICDYVEGSQGGIAAEAAKHIIEGLGQEYGEQVSFDHILSEELGFLNKCVGCGYILEEVTRIQPSQRFTCVQVNGQVREKVVLQDELSKDGWAACLNCCQEKNETPSSKKVLLEFLGGAATSLQGIEDNVHLGESTYEATVIVHFDEEENHFWTSMKDWKGSWWRLDDFCGSEELWRREYLRHNKSLSTIEGKHNLDAKIHMVLLEEISTGMQQQQCRNDVQREGGEGGERGGQRCVNGRQCEGGAESVSSGQECSSCSKPLCQDCSGASDYCMACRGINPDNPLSHKTWPGMTVPTVAGDDTAPPKSNTPTGRTRRGQILTSSATASSTGTAGTEGQAPAAPPTTSSPRTTSTAATFATAGNAGQGQQGKRVKAALSVPTTVSSTGTPTGRTRRGQILTSSATASSTSTAGTEGQAPAESYLNCDLNCEVWKMVAKDLDSGASLSDTAKKFHVTRKWIRYRCSFFGKKAKQREGHLSTQCTSQMKLTTAEEKLIVDTLLLRQEVGLPLTTWQLKAVVQAVLTDVTEADPNRTTGWERQHQMPNNNWVNRFLKRHKLSLRAKTAMKASREALTEEEVRLWAESTKAFFEKHAGITSDPRRILNLDETAVSQNTDGLKVIAKTGTKGGILAKEGDREYSTFVVSVNAAGEVFKPTAVLKGQRDVSATHLKGWSPPEHLKPQVLFSKKGFVDQSGMMKILETVSQSCLDKGINMPVILLLDCASSHLSKVVIEKAVQLGIHLWYIHPSATSILQVKH